MSNVIQGRAPDGTNKDFLVDALGNLALGNPVDALLTPGNITTQNLVPAGVATAGSAVEFDVAGISTLAFQVTGTYTGALSVQVRVDGGTWVTLGGTPLLRLSNGGYIGTVASAVQDVYQINVAGMTKVRITALAAVTGTAVVTPRGSVGAGASLQPVVLGTPQSTTTSSLVKAEDAAHASGDVGVFGLGVRYEALTAPASGAADYSLITVDDLGKTVTMPFAPPVNQVQGVTAAIVNTSDTSVIAAPGASIRNYITSVQITNSSATASVVELKDGSTVIARVYAPANGSTQYVFGTPLKLTANAVFNAACLITATNTYVSAQGFKGL